MDPLAIAHYKMKSKLGDSGAGDAYCATDTKLGRDVAIGVMPDAFARDANRMAWFARQTKFGPRSTTPI
jgi:serine/threonine protein kinase